MQRRGLITFVVLNVVISAAIVLAILRLHGGGGGGASDERLVTFEVIVTATPNPNITPVVIIVTATPDGGRATLPPSVIEGTAPSVAAVQTVDPTLLSEDAVLQETIAALPANCVPHSIADGENPSIIADIYGVSVFDLLAVNGLTEEDAAFLQIGEVLTVPLAGCSLIPTEPIIVSSEETPEVTVELASAGTSASEGTAESTAVVTALPTIRPTITLAPTAENAQVVIDQVINAGDITREEVVIRNTGNTLNLTGWTLSDSDGNVFVFDERRLFSGATLRINTRAGQPTPVVLFWGRDEAVFAPGDVVVLADANGAVQATLRLPASGSD